MTGYPNWNKEAFDRAEKRLRELGYDVFNPSWMQFTDGWSHEEIMAIDLAALEKCDAIAQLDGWPESKGAQKEFEQAKRMNKKIFMFVSEYGDLVEINYARRVIDEMGQFYKVGIDLALKDDFTAINNEEVKKDESASVGDASKEDEP